MLINFQFAILNLQFSICNYVLTVVLCVFASAFARAGRMDDGEQYYLKGRYSAAAAAYKKALTHDMNEQNRANCWYMLGQSYLMLGDMKNARQAFRKMPARYSKTEWLAHAYVGLGDTYYREKKYNTALEYYKKSMSARHLSQHGSTVYHRLARAHRALKQTSKAKYYEDVIRKNYPDSLEARLILSGKGGAARAGSSSGGSAKRYAVQISYTTRADYARDYARKFKKKGYDAYVDVTESKGRTRFRVLLGRYKGKEAAESLMRKIRKNEKIQAFVTTVSDD